MSADNPLARFGRAAGSAVEGAGSSVRTGITNAVASRIPGGSAVGAAGDLAQNFNSENLVAAGVQASKALLADATGGLSLLVTNKKSRNVILFIVGIILYMVISVVVQIYNTNFLDKTLFVWNNRDLISSIHSLGDISSNTFCIDSGADSTANAAGQHIAQTSHIDQNTLVKDCLAAKNAAKVLSSKSS